MPAAKRRGLAVGRGSPVYQVVWGQGGPVMPDEKTIEKKADSEPTINLDNSGRSPLTVLLSVATLNGWDASGLSVTQRLTGPQTV